MASAAAVAANEALSPERQLGEDTGVPGEVVDKTGVGETKPGDVEDDDDDDDDIQPSRGRRERPANDDEDGADNGLDDLFGDDDDEELPENPTRRLDDEELDSGDDMDRADRAQEDAAQPTQEFETMEKATLAVELPRQPAPEPSDGEMYLIKVPGFLEIQPVAWEPETFQPPSTDHHSKKEPSATFSLYNTAITTMRWRHSPADSAKLQSNARILRWSDGSLTLQLASDATTQYEIDGNSLAPPQRNPVKPTPTSITAGPKKAGRQGTGTVPGEKYDHQQDAFTYLVLPDMNSATMRVTHKITSGLSIKQTELGSDEAERRLQAALANAANATKAGGSDTIDMKVIDEDPEKARAMAEKAMQDKAKADKKREAAALRERERSQRAFDRPGRYGGGLNVGMLEDEDEMGGGRSRNKAAPRKRRQRAHGSEYSSDEDFGRQRFGNKEDDYDQEDDFLAPSDEEEEVADDDDDDDGIVEESSRRDRSPKRDRAEPKSADDDEDAEGEEDEGIQQARTKRRRIVDDDEDDDE